jgi:phenylacetate-CoA ligase
VREFMYRHVILPAYETVLHQRKNFRYWRDLERTQWLTRAEIEAIQFENLRRLITHAFENCPHYRETWKRLSLSPHSLNSPEDIRRWPLLRRDEVVANRPAMRAQVPGMRFITKTTSGSTGAPLTIEYDTGSEERRYGASYRANAWAGTPIGSKQLMLWGMPMGKRPLRQEWKDRLYAGIYRRRVLNSFELSEQRVPHFLEIHNRYKPDLITAYTNPLFTFARELERQGLKPHSPKSIMVGAEKLYDFQREVIERVFGAPVFETYGSREFMLTASECDHHKGLHLTMEHLLVEVLNEDGTPTPDGEEGNIVITDLFNYGMPLIRYVNNDRAIAGWTMCSCGRGLPLMRPPTGRTLDVVTTPDGRRVPGEFFPYLLNNVASVNRYHIVQDAPDHCEIRLVVRPEWGERDRTKVEEGVRLGVGPAMRFEIVLVDEIPLTNSGKLRVVDNRVARQAGKARELTSVET